MATLTRRTAALSKILTGKSSEFHESAPPPPKKRTKPPTHPPIHLFKASHDASVDVAPWPLGPCAPLFRRWFSARRALLPKNGQWQEGGQGHQQTAARFKASGQGRAGQDSCLGHTEGGCHPIAAHRGRTYYNLTPPRSYPKPPTYLDVSVKIPTPTPTPTPPPGVHHTERLRL